MSSLMATIGYAKARWYRLPMEKIEEENVRGKVVVLTGGNSGIGAVAALEFAKRGAILVNCCRDVEKGNKVMAEIKLKVPNHQKLELIPLDLGDLSSVRTCADKIKKSYPQIHILVNNAGLAFGDGKHRKTKDGFEIHFGVNHLGHFLLTELLLDNIKNAAPSRIVTVSSMTHLDAELELDDINLEKRGSAFGYENRGPYSNSKLANIYHGAELGKRLEGSGVTTYALCPGPARTDIFRGTTKSLLTKMILRFISITSEEGAENILYCALAKETVKETGLMYRCNAIWEGVDKSLKSNVSESLHEQSMKLVGLS